MIFVFLLLPEMVNTLILLLELMCFLQEKNVQKGIQSQMDSLECFVLIILLTCWNFFCLYK